MGVQDLVRVVLPKDDRFYDFLEEQAKLAHECALALAELGGESGKSMEGVARIRERVHEVEKRCDKVTHQLEDALAETFVTPLDREDIHKLASLIDDILDRAYACASAFEMYSIDRPSPAAIQFFDVLERATALLKDTLPALRKHDFDAIRAGRRQIKTIEKEGDELYRRTMKALFSEPVSDARLLIREKEVIEILEDAVDTSEDAAEYLANLAVKHG
jgi:uncharacterized protein Yka (UPF0111/DUF47 family)